MFGANSTYIADVLGFNELKPIESDNRFGLSSPVFLSIIIMLYLLFVYKIGPSFMRNREPYKLKGFVSIYNVFQVASCIYILKTVWLIGGWTIFNFSECLVYEANTPRRQIYDGLTYFAYWIKISEFTDTVMFVLRKKQNQITYLHVFHHSATLTLVYLLLKYYRGSGSLYPIFLNCSVHVIMYSYYLLANIFGAEAMKRLVLIKKSITIIQMVQFVCILSQAAIMWKTCKVPMILRLYYSLVVLVFFYGFYDFYKKAYIIRRNNKVAAKQS